VTVVGRLSYLGVLTSIVMVLAGAFQTGVALAEGIMTIVAGLLTGLLSAALGFGLLNGKEWARRFTLWVSPLVLAVDIVAGNNGLLESGFSWWRFAAGLGFYLVFAFVLTRPNALAFFKSRSSATTTAV
jgi:peptidoglycan/LPS O-acetylase OafA/YrhL